MIRCGSEVLKGALEAGARPEVWVRFPRLLGDVVFSLPFLGSLQREWNAVAEAAGTRLKWIAVGHDTGVALFSEAHPDFISECVVETKGQDKPDPWHLMRRWRSERPVAVLNLSQSLRLSLGAWVARVPIRAGDVDNHLRFLYQYRFTYRDLPVHIVRRFDPLFTQLTGKDGIHWLPIVPERFGGLGAEAKLRAAGWGGEPYVALAFGTRGYPKRWFPEREKWPALARLLKERGWNSVWLGGPDEVALGAELAAAVPGSLDLTGRTTIPEACAIQFGAVGNVGIDTGLAHSAAGTGRPTVTLMGTSSALYTPLGPRALAMRGPAVDVEGLPTLEADLTYGSSAHRITPRRVADLLAALVAEENPETDK